MKQTLSLSHLSRRKRQIMDVLYRLGEASVAEVVAHLPDQPDYHAVRVTLANLEKEGYVHHREEGPRYIYRPAVPPEEAERTAVQHLLKTFFAGSPSRAILTILDVASTQLPPAELKELARKIEEAGEEDGQ